MPATDDHESLTLPEGTRLFYIGPPKTGTTSLQEAARAARDTLYENGVYYPGTDRHHRVEIFALMQQMDWLAIRVDGKQMQPGANYWDAGRVPPKSQWTRFVDEIDSESSKRVLVTHEWAASASDEEADAFVRSLGRDRTHIVITLRAMSEVLPSQWIESLKEGQTATFEEWLKALYSADDRIVPARMRRYLDHAGVVERWARCVGRDNVTVIVVDKNDRNFLIETFEGLLGLPDRTLQGNVSGGWRTNRSLSQPESDLIQRVNSAVVHPDEMSWPAYLTVVRRGATQELLDARAPQEDEARVRLPQWALEHALRDGRDFADRIAATGVRVVGDLTQLYAGPGELASADSGADVESPLESVGTADEGALRDAEVIREIAVESLVGAVRATTSYEKRLARRIDRAREQRDRARERREKLQARLERVTASRDKARDALERQKAKTQKSQERFAGQKEKLQQARRELARLRRRTIRDQVKGLSEDQRARKAAESFSTRDLAQALRIRLGHKARTRRSLGLK